MKNFPKLLMTSALKLDRVGLDLSIMQISEARFVLLCSINKISCGS